jgi:alkaline phosphatase
MIKILRSPRSIILIRTAALLVVVSLSWSCSGSKITDAGEIPPTYFSPRTTGIENSDQEGKYPPAKNVILFIGDGMGAEHRKAARWFGFGLDGELAMDQLETHGLILTHSANRVITDSAAAATAMATGVKTKNGVIGLDRNFQVVATILEQAQLQGKATGLVTTTSLNHATPAAFASHVISRNMMTEIASQYLEAGVEVLLGGGEDEFLPVGEPGCFPEDGERDDGRNLIVEAERAGYIYICDPDQLLQIDPVVTDQLLGLFADDGLADPFAPSLAEMTGVALDILSRDDDGFFLMVEGGQIDWASHSNQSDKVLSRMLSFDEAIQEAISRPGILEDTLIIVAADHETGGLSLSESPQGKRKEEGPFLMPDGDQFYIIWKSTKHTVLPVPVSAGGPLAHNLEGLHDNTFIYDLMYAAMFGIEDQGIKVE